MVKPIFRSYIILFLFIVLVAVAVLSYVTVSKLRWESFHRHYVLSESLTARINNNFERFLLEEERRGVGDYDFLVVENGRITRSILSSSLKPGVKNYFQIDLDNNQVTTPFLPADLDTALSFGLTQPEYNDRLKVLRSIRGLLSQTELMPIVEQSVVGIQNIILNEPFQRPINSSKKVIKSDQEVKDQLTALQKTRLQLTDLVVDGQLVQNVEARIEPFVLNSQDNDFLLYRKVFLNDSEKIQGVILNKMDFLQAMARDEFERSPLSELSQLVITYEDEVLFALGAKKTIGSSLSLYNTALQTLVLPVPFEQLTLAITVHDLPLDSSVVVVVIAIVVLVVTLLLSAWLLYRYLLSQQQLVLRQNNFVSSVSHELKTPLTSIRMYGEVLQKGWADDAKKQQYYGFILEEGERLTRLIDNILHFTQIQKSTLKANIESHSIASLKTLFNKNLSFIEQKNFVLEMGYKNLDAVSVLVDSDLLLQIMINLVDNSLKYAGQSDKKVVRVDFLKEDAHITVAVRDYGPGINDADISNVFEMFYRAGDELTREHPGVGIGLTLVHHYAQLTGAELSLKNQNPGLEVRILLPIANDQLS